MGELLRNARHALPSVKSRNDDIRINPFPLTLIARKSAGLTKQSIYENNLVESWLIKRAESAESLKDSNDSIESAKDSNDFKKQYEKDIQGKKWIYKV